MPIQIICCCCSWTTRSRTHIVRQASWSLRWCFRLPSVVRCALVRSEWMMLKWEGKHGASPHRPWTLGSKVGGFLAACCRSQRLMENDEHLLKPQKNLTEAYEKEKQIGSVVVVVVVVVIIWLLLSFKNVFSSAAACTLRCGEQLQMSARACSIQVPCHL